ncbi:MAG: FlgD immunoglobulin-like domain containing protein [candidate division Zixibacteria bacterium]|nr:FlgD immunoglobulin-like domain containing protein [candidate division Zixibacteria bacterium]
MITNNVLCFTPADGIDSIYWFIIQACDSCGVPTNPSPPSPINSCVTDSFFIHVRFNQPPVVQCAVDDTVAFDCGPSEVCLSSFTATDPDNNIVSQTVSLGTLSDGTVCFLPDTAGLYTIIYTVTDAFGASDQCEAHVLVQYDNQPPVATCPGSQTMTVCDLSQICIDGFSCADPNDNLTSCTVIGGTLNGNTVCFTPVAGVNTITLIATDACGAADTCITTVTVNVIPPPQLSDTVRTVAMCAPGQTCVGLPQVTGGQAPYVWEYNGQTVTGQICFNLNDDSLVTGLIKVTDSCGRTDIATLVVHAVVNTAPVVTVTVTSPQFVCQTGGQVCAKLTIVDPDNTLSGTSTIGTVNLSDSTVCFAADTSGHYCNTVIIADSCSLKDTVSYCVDVNLNDAPVCQLPGDTTYTMCEPIQICRPVSATDADGNLVGCEIVSGPGTIINNNWCYMATESGSVDVTIKCTDQCAAACEGSFTTTFNVDRPPVVTCQVDTSFVMPVLQEICLIGFECYDPDGDLVSCTSNRGPINGGQICFLPEEGLNNIIVEAEDACGRIASCTTRVWVVVVRECPVVRLEKTEGTLQGHSVNLELTIENAGLFQVAGFDFLIAYDASALTFIQAEKGDLLANCGWEYFTYRFGPNGNCGTGCPSGMLRLIALAETNNGVSHPSCYGPSDLGVHGLANLTFFVSNDRTFECQYAPVYFYWYNCGDNAVSNIDGDSMIIDSKIFDFEGGVIWDEFDDSNYPDEGRPPFTGAGDSCLVGFKVTPYRCLEFWNGGVDIVCADSIDARGDINLNGIANEVADAVMLTNYFINGLAAFSAQEGSIAASDVNADGISLSVADLVYLIRIIVGDAVPYAKPLPNASFAVQTHTVDEGLEVEYEASSMVGAVLMTFAVDGSCGTPIAGAGAAGMDVVSSLRGNELRVLVYNIGTQGIAAGNNVLMTIPGDAVTLTSVEAADYNGGAMATSTRAIPTEFELAQNYPNPFNPTTAIKLNLATASEWTISIFNVAGQKVREYTGRSDAGTVQVVWDAADFDGNRVASGIYLYRATAGGLGATKKMVLMK